MTLNIQITVDCNKPHELAEWWAETLDWAVEPQDENFIRSMIEQGYATEADTQVHRGKLVWRAGAAIRPPDELDTKNPPRRLLFQTVAEEKTTKNRVHWDVRLDGRDKDEVRAAPGSARRNVPLDGQPGAARMAHHGGPGGQRVLHQLSGLLDSECEQRNPRPGIRRLRPPALAHRLRF